MDDVKWLIAREIPYLRRCARALARDPDLADDVVQDAVERALRKRHLWRPRGSLRAWLYRLMYNVYVNRRDRPAVERLATSLDSAGESSAPARQELHVEARDLVEALARLPHDQRAAIVLTGMEGLSYDEAAYVLDIPIGTLRSRIHRGRETLRAAQHGHREGSPDTLDSGQPPIRRVK